MRIYKSAILIILSIAIVKTAFAWTDLGAGVYLSETTEVTGFRMLDDGSVKVRFADNTSAPCNGSSFISLNGPTEKATANLFSFALMARANSESLYVKIGRVGDSCSVLEMRSN